MLYTCRNIDTEGFDPVFLFESYERRVEVLVHGRYYIAQGIPILTSQGMTYTNIYTKTYNKGYEDAMGRASVPAIGKLHQCWF